MKRLINAQNGKITFVNDDKNASSPNLPVSGHLAKMIEQAVTSTGLKVNINSTTGGNHAARSFHQFGMAVDINSINDKRIDDPGNFTAVRRFQQFISQHQDVSECFGPFINIRKKSGQVIQKPEMKQKHLNHLHISSQR